MAYVTPTTQESFDANINFLESRINQETPAADKAYNTVLADMMAMNQTSLYKFATDRAKEVLTISASIIGLRVIGQGRGIPEKVATSAVITFDVVALAGTVIDTSVIYVADATGVRYKPNAQAQANASNIATITATALTAGTVGNIAVGQTLKADRQVPGADQKATVTLINTTAADPEGTEAYRQRLLDDERTEGGGSNYADYRKNAELTPGVFRAYPYSGNPTYLETGTGAIYPGQRTIYIKADSSIDPDGVAPQSLLDLAEEYIKTNQETGKANEVLGGDSDSGRFVKSIRNTTFFVKVVGLDISTDIEAKVKEDIETATKAYFRSVQPFIKGLDFILDKNEVVTVPSVTQVVQDVVRGAGGSFTSLTIDIGAGSIPDYTPGAGELVKLADSGGITYE